MAPAWSQVRDVVDAVLELPPQERSSYLDRACPDPAVRLEVDSLVYSYDRAGDFLQSPANDISSLWAELDGHQAWKGRRLGPYELIEEIGRGGMGSVYRAIRADDQYRKQVAVKLVRCGFESAFALSRFRAERQILATLEHPNIARLLDGGTTEGGIPYFVMELIEGQPIDQYCDVHCLPLRARLELFRSVCSALEYAHQNLVIHRDLKPGNILVTKDGVPKLLDFGIAKIISEEPLAGAEPTIALLRVLTPEYASPEQITGAPVNTSADIYSLGVVLYVLLTGHRPYSVDGRRPDEMARAICQTEPLKPSVAVVQNAQAPAKDGAVPVTAASIAARRGTRPQKLRHQLAGDIDNIVLKAMRKEPERRYGSVEQFSEDIRRHFAGLPLRARVETLGYRAQKFVARNALGLAAAGLLLVFLCGGLLATMHEASIAHAQQVKADRRFQDVRELANSMMFEVHDAIADLPGATSARKLLVERALKYLDGLAKDAKGDRSLQLELATAYDKFGDVQGQPMEANLGDPGAAIASYEKALRLREALAASNPNDALVARDLVLSYIRLSDLLGYRGEPERALDYARKEIPTAEKLDALQPFDLQNRVLLAGAYVDQGFKEAKSGDRASGLETLRRGAEMFRQLLSDRPEDLSLRRKLALTYGRIGDVLRFSSAGNADSLASFRAAINTLQPSLSRDPNNAEIRRILAYDERSIGELLSDMGEKPAALVQEREALKSFRTLAAADPTNAQLQQDIACVQARIGMLLVELGDAPGAISELEQAVLILEKASTPNGPQSYYGFRLLQAEHWLGKAQMVLASSAKLTAAQRSERCAAARSLLQKSIPGYESLRDKGPDYDAGAALEDIRREMLGCQG